MTNLIVKYILWFWTILVTTAFIIVSILAIKNLYAYSNRIITVEKPVACTGLARLEEEKRLQLKEILELEAENKRLKGTITQAITGLQNCLKNIRP